MTLRRRILLYYSVTLACALAIVGFWSWFEFEEQRHVAVHHGPDAAMQESPILETFEIIVFGGLPAALLGIAAGMILVRRALRPIRDLTEILEKTDAANLSDPVPCNGNGDELDRMAMVFNAMKSRLNASFTQAREFTLHASHELKTPLTIMHATLEQMMRDETAAASFREGLASMLEEVQRLSTIVSQLTLLAKADAGQLSITREPVSLDALLREVAEDAVILAAGAAIAVELGECAPLIVRGDRMRLRQLLLNLADNAIKHNRKGGRVALSLSRQDADACLVLTNTGPILPPELRARVFERFFRGDIAHGSDKDGSGLGLSIAQFIAQAHDGSLTLDVTPEGLTRVSLRLPLA